MDTRRVGRTSITLPEVSGPGIYLTNVASLENPRGTVQDFRYADADLRELDLLRTHLITGRITGLRADRVQLADLRVDSVEFDSCDLGSTQWSDSKLSRVVFRNCRLMGADLARLTLDNVLFEGCKLDYATWEGIRATGPVAFSKSVLTEATFTGCDLSRAVFDACTLRLTEFGRGTYKELDLRGNDLSTVRGVTTLKKIIIDRSQQPELAEALVAELDVTFGDTLDDRR
ncbi:pentapeptide repeat-containing protein [Kitasatospora azatica]|uniref:pentapeptide repeat-containing protein n=1 Tax=Kitasatospora azatica TaxID=58347 RepID=UPI00068CDDB8|nr:pentapeptide repeat-containing protein [Kitasatospora azatica]